MSMDIQALVESKARAARAAASVLALTPTGVKNEALHQMARGLEEQTAALVETNRGDVERARGQGVSSAFLDRLTLTESRIQGMAQGLREIAALPDPVGAVVDAWRRPSGIEISRVRVPLGVIVHLRVPAQRDGGRRRALPEVSNAMICPERGLGQCPHRGHLGGRRRQELARPSVLEPPDRQAVGAMLALDGWSISSSPRRVRALGSQNQVPVLRHDKGLITSTSTCGRPRHGRPHRDERQVQRTSVYMPGGRTFT
jgi:glutamate-5-semialdehyde dehydrogenase